MSDLEDGVFYKGSEIITADTSAVSLKIVDQDAGVIVNAEVVVTDPKMEDLTGDDLVALSMVKLKAFF